MNRRTFFKSLGVIGAAIAVYDDSWLFLPNQTKTFAAVPETVALTSDLAVMTQAIAAEVGRIHMEKSRRPFMVGAVDIGQHDGQMAACDWGYEEEVGLFVRRSAENLYKRVTAYGVPTAFTAASPYALMGVDCSHVRVIDPSSGICVEGFRGNAGFTDDKTAREYSRFTLCTGFRPVWEYTPPRKRAIA